MDGFVLTDASLLIGLAREEGLQWLQPLFGVVWIPVEVQLEVLSAGSSGGFAEEAAILHALAQGWLQVCGPTPLEPNLPDLDEGEADCPGPRFRHSDQVAAPYPQTRQEHRRRSCADANAQCARPGLRRSPSKTARQTRQLHHGAQWVCVLLKRLQLLFEQCRGVHSGVEFL